MYVYFLSTTSELFYYGNINSEFERFFDSDGIFSISFRWCYHVHIRLLQWWRFVPLIHVRIPVVQEQYGHCCEVKGINGEKAKGNVFSIVTSVVWHLELCASVSELHRTPAPLAGNGNGDKMYGSCDNIGHHTPNATSLRICC